MAWEGYFSIGSGTDEVELINVARTEAYAAHLRWFKPGYNSDLLPVLLGETYIDPAVDDAPWYDANNPVSAEFFGLYPIEISGIEDSTRSSNPIESTIEGSIPGRLTERGKTIVFSGTLLAASQRGAEYGFQWLKRATRVKPCLPGTPPNTLGHTMHYLAVDPSLDPGCAAWAGSMAAMVDGGYFDGGVPVSVDTPLLDGGDPGGTGTLLIDGGTPWETGGVIYSDTPPFVLPAPYSPALGSWRRTLRWVQINNGPRVLAKHDMTDGGASWNVTFTATVGRPWEYGEPVMVIEGFNDPLVVSPYPPGIEPGPYDEVGSVYFEVACPEPVWSPLFNPVCSPVVEPPTVPVVNADCFPTPPNWWRRRAAIPAQYIPVWADAVPVIQIHAPDTDVTMLRMRIYADLSQTGDPDDNPCAVMADYVINYIPADMTMVFDGVAEAVYVLDPNTLVQRRSDSLVANTDGEPFVWPTLTCGLGFIVTFDQLDDETPTSIIDVALVPRNG